MSTPIRTSQPSHRQLLARLLEDPGLVAAVQRLPPRALGKLIDHVGLEDAGELVALATTEQLRHIFDDDLWNSERAGQDEAFDADRFALWLEVMLEAGEDFAADRLAELPEDLLVLALHRHVLVLDMDRLALEMVNLGEDAALTEKALDSTLHQELAEFRIIARRSQGFDAIVTALLALDKNHHHLLQRILERCCHLSAEYIEDNGTLYDVLSAEDMLESDLASEREDRRAREGFVAPSAAASFLNLARTSALPEIEAQGRDPIARAYFRELDPAGQPAPAPRRAESPAERADSARLSALLREAEVLPEAQPSLLTAGDPNPHHARGEDLFQRAMIALHARDPLLHGQRIEELAFVTNVLIAGCGFAGRRLRPSEAARAAVATCNLGLAYVSRANAASGPRLAPDDVLARDGADKLFRIGFHLLHAEVALPACWALERALRAGSAAAADAALAARIEQAHAAVAAAAAARKPSAARAALERLEELDGGLPFDAETAQAVKALLDDCPHLAGALAGARGSSEFIAVGPQLRAARAFARELGSAGDL